MRITMANQPNQDPLVGQDEILDQERDTPNGTGHPPAHLSDISDRNVEAGERINRTTQTRATGDVPTGGDIEADPYQAQVMGEEAVGGTTPTPGQDSTEALADAAGIEVRDGKPIQTRDDLERRDQDRWELDPDSARNRG